MLPFPSSGSSYTATKPTCEAPWLSITAHRMDQARGDENNNGDGEIKALIVAYQEHRYILISLYKNSVTNNLKKESGS